MNEAEFILGLFFAVFHKLFPLRPAPAPKKKHRRRLIYRRREIGRRIPSIQISVQEMEWLGELADSFEHAAGFDGMFMTPDCCGSLASRLRSLGLQSANAVQPQIEENPERSANQ